MLPKYKFKKFPKCVKVIKLFTKEELLTITEQLENCKSELWNGSREKISQSEYICWALKRTSTNCETTKSFLIKVLEESGVITGNFLSWLLLNEDDVDFNYLSNKWTQSYRLAWINHLVKNINLYLKNQDVKNNSVVVPLLEDQFSEYTPENEQEEVEQPND